MKIKVKKLHPSAVIPSYAKHGDAGLDLTATTKYYDNDGNICYGIGLAIEIPQGYVGLLIPRSSNAKKFLAMSNSIGVIDSGYRGELTAKFKPSPIYRNPHDLDLPYNPSDYEVGERIAQLLIIPYPVIELEEVNELSDSERGAGGYGSTGH